MSDAGLLITLSGLDGAGKSTLGRRLQVAIEAEYHLSTKYVWCKYGISPLRHLSRRLGLRQYRSFNPRHEKGGAFKIYGIVLLIFHLAQIAFVVRRNLKRGYAVICDRYIYDTVIDLHQVLGIPLETARKMVSAHWIPQPRASFFLDLPATLAVQRKNDGTTVEFLAERLEAYQIVCRECALVTIDATQPLNRVFELLMENIRQTQVVESQGVRDR